MESVRGCWGGYGVVVGELCLCVVVEVDDGVWGLWLVVVGGFVGDGGVGRVRR